MEPPYPIFAYRNLYPEILTTADANGPNMKWQ